MSLGIVSVEFIQVGDPHIFWLTFLTIWFLAGLSLGLHFLCLLYTVAFLTFSFFTLWLC